MCVNAYFLPDQCSVDANLDKRVSAVVGGDEQVAAAEVQDESGNHAGGAEQQVARPAGLAVLPAAGVRGVAALAPAVRAGSVQGRVVAGVGRPVLVGDERHGGGRAPRLCRARPGAD